MAVVMLTELTISPDRYDHFIETTRKAKAVLDKCGARNVRLLSAITAGEASGSLVMSWEADDFASQGTVLDKFMRDPEGMNLLEETNTSAGPTIGLGRSSTWTEVPL